MNQSRMLGRLRRRSRHELSTRHVHTREWGPYRTATSSGQGRCSHYECDATKPYRSYKRAEERQWRRELSTGDE